MAHLNFLGLIFCLTRICARGRYIIIRCRNWPIGLLEVNQHPSLVCDTPVDRTIKANVVRDTLSVMTWHHNNRVYGSLADHTTIAASSVSGGFTCVYPSLLQKYYDQFLCFPFPQELFDDKYLDPQQQYMLMTLLRNQPQSR